ncbi:uncharacterized protein LOC115962017 [Quercus lobata]|uniref:uncharacterized protein LOC115962017 n=1 Tax=Quercus lobata TaxID=97700 RepID=UPI0012492A21|nr:uncharacterized protein LOC115962017 [Quercus lobata]
MLVKSQDEGRHLDDLQETFDTLRQYHIKLNLSKCAFGVSSGKFIGFMVSHRGIEANPNKIQAILDMKPLQNTKEIQSLTGRVAALNKFVSKTIDKSLIREEDKVQRPVYYTSKALKIKKDLVQFLKKNIDVFAWSHEDMPGIDLSVITHLLNVCPSSKPVRQKKSVFAPKRDGAIKDEVQKLMVAKFIREVYYPDWLANVVMVKKANGKWRMYQPRHAIKAQALADFIAEFTPSHDETEDSKRWVIHVDGSSTRHAGGIGVVLQSPEGDKLKHKVHLQYQATNNEVEYEALLKGLELAKSVEAKSILVLGDSQLIMGQVKGMYEAKEERMKKYLSRVMRLMKRFEKADFVQIPREESVEADTIAKEASANESMDESDEVQYMPSIDVPEVQQVDSRGNWMTSIISYLKDG